MTDRDLERRVYTALSHAAPDDLDGVLSRCAPRKGDVIPMTKQTPHSNPARRRFARLAAACLALILVGGGFGFQYQQAHAVASVVSLDVNPSIQLTVNNREKVLSCTPLNQEAKEILAEMGEGADLAGTKLDVAVNAIVGSLVRHGYLDSISSAILISVEDKDQNRAAQLQQELTDTVDAVLRQQSLQANVLSQTITQEPELETMARENNLSTGKAYLVRQVMEMNGTVSTNSTTALDALSALSVEELRDLLKTGETRIPIGKSSAAYAAEAYAGTLAMDSVTAEVDPELDDTPAHYEVELHTSLGEFEYRVDAFTGQVLSGQPNLADSVQQPGTSSYIGERAAKTAALNHAGLTESAVTWLKAEQDWDDGRLEYELEFKSGSTKYDYTIDGTSGLVLDYEVDSHAAAAGSAGDIGSGSAKAAALSHAGLAESSVTRIEVEQDWDHGRLKYEVEFKSGDMEYEYTIDGATGAVLEHSMERDD